MDRLDLPEILLRHKCLDSFRHTSDNKILSEISHYPVMDKLWDRDLFPIRITQNVNNILSDATGPEKFFEIKRIYIHPRLESYRIGRNDTFFFLIPFVVNSEKRTGFDKTVLRIFNQKLDSRPCIGTLLNFIKKYECTSLDERAETHNRKIPDYCPRIKIPVECLSCNRILYEVDFNEIFEMPTGKLSYRCGFSHLSCAIKKDCFF